LNATKNNTTGVSFADNSNKVASPHKHCGTSDLDFRCNIPYSNNLEYLKNVIIYI